MPATGHRICTSAIVQDREPPWVAWRGRSEMTLHASAPVEQSRRSRRSVRASMRVALGLLAIGFFQPASAALLTHQVPLAVLEHKAQVTGHADPALHLQLAIALPMRNLDALDRTLAAI